MARRTRSDAEISAEALKLDLPTEEPKAEVIEPETSVETPDAPTANPEPKKRHQIPDEDIGNWRFTPWKGRPMWTHNSGSTSFSREHVSRHRNQ